MYKRLFSLFLLCAVALSLGACAATAGKTEVSVVLSDGGVTVDGGAASADPSAAVHVGGEIIYYRDGTGETYGEGTAEEMHSAEEAAAHTVVTITRSGVYRVSGTLSRGQLFVDLGEDAKRDPDAVVTLILDGTDITCTVAPAVFFYRVYECDEAWVAYDEGEAEGYDASGIADTAAAGANVILAAGSDNSVTGSHVARIYKEGTTKKLHKYDGAFYSRMSMNLSGDGADDSGALRIVADNEGLGSELHLSVNGGTLSIQARDDGINANGDGVSVITVSGGSLNVNAGLGAEGDGIDSNGYLTINGGTVWTMSNERSPDGGIDAVGPILINGGTLSAFGTRNDAADADASAQPYMELSFASTLPAGSAVAVLDPDGEAVWSAATQKTCQSITLTAPGLQEDTAYTVFVDGVQQQYTGGMGGGPSGDAEPPEGFEEGRRPQRGEDGASAGDFTPGRRPDGGADPAPPGGEAPPEGMDGGEPPEGFVPGRENPGGGDGQGASAGETGSTAFTLSGGVRAFSGVSVSPAGAGKTQVSFTVNGGAGVASGGTVVLSDIQASVSGLPDSDVQITITDVPSEDYAETCLLSDGAQALAAILPTADGAYQLTVAVADSNETYTGVSQWRFTVGAPLPSGGQ